MEKENELQKYKPLALETIKKLDHASKSEAWLKEEAKSRKSFFLRFRDDEGTPKVLICDIRMMLRATRRSVDSLMEDMVDQDLYDLGAKIMRKNLAPKDNAQ